MAGKQFNKKNVQKFADSLYEKKKDGAEYYRPLCRKVLAKKNGELVGCILGDLYEEFTGKLVARPLTKQELEDVNLIEQHLYDVGFGIEDIEPKLVQKSGLMPKICERDIADELSKKAKIRDGVVVDNLDLPYEILDLVGVNDSIKGESEPARIKRAKEVQKELNEIAEKYLA